ncbi:putative nucleic acid binding protein [apricot vein clearing associated virus]|uniref:RNA silencing suppressor n=1 Tax=Prunevirus armeniacae TaxID=1343920 RepID=W0UT97_9VIRU|nr:putative nucleic acid binding protein [Apricot vein clearing associated virus]BCA25724.1 nucleic acid-binding protein [Apricot vein clearing associated virus]CDF66419.1 putative nucleic acid binding protein [Apricot vein clearing associated virus]
MHLDKHVLVLGVCLKRLGLPTGPMSFVLYKAMLVRKLEIQEEQAKPLCGVSTFAIKRRAKRLGVCYRCMRVNPKFYFTTRCDNLTCHFRSFGLKERYVRFGLGKNGVELRDSGHFELTKTGKVSETSRFIEIEVSRCYR